ncbi:GSCFA domain-containing protein [Planktotalea sp.]|uniref:GSCFA domain-containing protein n=1 Tax=Planktotalea sp. TaxID=2029877 RepID=UPI003296FBBB
MLEKRAFWAPSVGEKDALEINELWEPKWPIKRDMKIATFGSCFAQHFGRSLASRGYHWFDAEPAPTELLPETAKAFNYGVFSARTGNIYSVSLLRQWVEWALGVSKAPDEVWEKEGRFYDPFRPAVEPNGFASAEEVLASRELTIESFGHAIKDSNLFVFTLGLTESWWNSKDEYEYPICPGTVAGTYIEGEHEFRNQSYPFIKKNLMQALRLIRSVNPQIRVLLTVSPVPLTATKADDHVLVATSYSKSTLRAVAGDIAKKHRFVDYFPSYEIISSPPFGGQFYSANKRGVEQDGVDHVMSNFFACMAQKYPKLVRSADNKKLLKKPNSKLPVKPTIADKGDDLVCEEELLSAFAPKS